MKTDPTFQSLIPLKQRLQAHQSTQGGNRITLAFIDPPKEECYPQELPETLERTRCSASKKFSLQKHGDL